LDVDFIGGQGPFTKDEEIAIGELITAAKSKREMHQAKIGLLKMMTGVQGYLRLTIFQRSYFDTTCVYGMPILYILISAEPLGSSQ
jgi:hypothetical protein